MENYLNRRAGAARPKASVIAIQAILDLARGQSAAAIEKTITTRISKFVSAGGRKRRPTASPAWEPIGRLSAPVIKRPAVGKPLATGR